MKIWEPKSFLICFDAKNGSLVVGIIHLVGAILNILYCLSGALSIQIQVAGLANLPSCRRDPAGDMCLQQLHKTGLLLNVAVVAIYSVQSLVCIMMIHGVRKRKNILMLPYMAYIASVITFYIIGYGFGMYFYSPEIHNALKISGVIGLITLVESYFLLVVRSHYHELRRTRDVNGNYKRLQEC